MIAYAVTELFTLEPANGQLSLESIVSRTTGDINEISFHTT